MSDSVQGRLLHGDFLRQGFGVTWFEFSSETGWGWGNHFRPDALTICLNHSGVASLGEGSTGVTLSTGEVVVCLPGGGPWIGQRSAGSVHRFFMIELGADYLRCQFRMVFDGMLPEVRAFCDGGGAADHAPYLKIHAIPTQLLGLRMQLLDPPVGTAAHGLWYQSKITEVVSHFLFKPEAPAELFCEQHHRINRERCERVLFLLRRDMENPPSLQMLADEVGCSPFHLSRLFAQEFGMGIPRALRKLRIERAAELIRDEGWSVTDAAMRVGYSSLGAFNKAFSEIFGCNPGQFLRGKNRSSN